MSGLGRLVGAVDEAPRDVHRDDRDDHHEGRDDVDHWDRVEAGEVLGEPDRKGLEFRTTVKVVTTISSKLRAKASRLPASSADRISGNLTYRKV